MKWFRRKASDHPEPPTGAFDWDVTDRGNGTCVVRVRLRQEIPGAFPHLSAVALHSVPDAVEISDLRICDGAEPDTQTVYRFPHLNVSMENLRPGDERHYEIPIARSQVAGLVFGSLTNLAWLETSSGSCWFAHHERRATLMSWADEIGSDPLMSFYDVRLSPEPHLVVSAEHPEPILRSQFRPE